MLTCSRTVSPTWSMPGWRARLPSRPCTPGPRQLALSPSTLDLWRNSDSWVRPRSRPLPPLGKQRHWNNRSRRSESQNRSSLSGARTLVQTLVGGKAWPVDRAAALAAAAEGAVGAVLAVVLAAVAAAAHSPAVGAPPRPPAGSPGRRRAPSPHQTPTPRAAFPPPPHPAHLGNAASHRHRSFAARPAQGQRDARRKMLTASVIIIGRADRLRFCRLFRQGARWVSHSQNHTPSVNHRQDARADGPETAGCGGLRPASASSAASRTQCRCSPAAARHRPDRTRDTQGKVSGPWFPAQGTAALGVSF